VLLGDQARQDIIYNNTTDIWTCCGTIADNNVNCSTPTDEHFIAAAPSLLTPTFSVGSVVQTVAASETLSTRLSVSSTTRTSSVTSLLTASSVTLQSPVPTGLSTGAKAGIGIGVATAVVAVLVSAFCFVKRYRTSAMLGQRQSERYSTVQDGHRETHELSALYNKAELDATSRPKESTPYIKAELDATHRPQEI
jgi:hypothetical protein